MRSWHLALELTLGLMVASGISSCRSPEQSSSLGGPYGEHLPHSEAQFAALGDAAMRLDADKSPLRKFDPVEGEWLIEGSLRPWPDGPVSQISPICESQWILGGRCLQLRYQYSVPGEVISDLVIVSWDALEKMYSIQLYSSGWPLPNSGMGRWNGQTASVDFVINTVNPATELPIKTLYRLWDIKPDSHRWSQYRTNERGELEAFFNMNASRAPAP